jgi:hypothetical protein
MQAYLLEIPVTAERSAVVLIAMFARGLSFEAGAELMDDLSKNPIVTPGRLKVNIKENYVRIELWAPPHINSPFKRLEMDIKIHDGKELARILRDLLEGLPQ